ncbi:protein-L-isoaspartate(D-aspartate) O-methyltransferase [Pontibacter sp. G13]|uniref:protein-L-isoaspartate(D-aspartate) O-methyltransferase n=1 Tax=Pontibacter sp. G13 TaxID=3074898 RepID=UPI002889B8F1|nr:protein-L-isoaspartate(D-aspartate) O-methyltransferase [Pontibacter sp. G13]WNJ20503.1 protein-L-isoaspartate(D-aspartate) O-methyltransferase [Pontibacter sp. G13]
MKGLRKRMVQGLRESGISDERVLEAMAEVPRHFFVEGAFSAQAYADKALPIAKGQTISQPYTVAYQTQLLRLKRGMKVLEIGTGSGYQAAVLCQMGMKLHTVEMIPRLHSDAKEKLSDLGFRPKMLLGDGSQGWAAHEPYERILVTAACPEIPLALKQQLAVGGRMVLPVGNLDLQFMTIVQRISRHEYEIGRLHEFQFVPLRGKSGFQ